MFRWMLYAGAGLLDPKMRLSGQKVASCNYVVRVVLNIATGRFLLYNIHDKGVC